MLLKVSNLEVCYGPISALQDVSLEIDRGEIVTLIGANGAGKSTMLRAISGLIRPERGQIQYDDQHNLVGLAPHRIVSHGLSHVPEGRQIFAELTVRENLQLGAYQRRVQSLVQQDLDRCYAIFPILKERHAQRAGTLSGGEQQMLAIARALMARPKLLLLDEPSLGLAPLIVRKIFQIIREINSEGVTIFLVEQNAHTALRVAHRGYVLQNGRVILSDRAAALLEHPEMKKAYLGG